MRRRGAFLLVLAAFFLLLRVQLPAQTSIGFNGFPRFNPPPCDFSDSFYTENGFSVTNLDTPGAGRFGNFRQTGPPAFSPSQLNWVNDSNCSVNDPTRRNVRVLATTGAYKDDDGAPTQFFSLIAFLLNQNFFTGGAHATPNVRGFTTQAIVANFEAYSAPKQLVNNVLAPTPCGSLHDPTLAANPCFPVTSVATPTLRQDWRIASNRNAIDGSSNGPATPFGYFCDDLTGSWIVTYFWYTQFSVGGISSNGTVIRPTPTCLNVLIAAARQNGLTLDGTPIIHTGDELHFLEGVASNPQFGLPLSAQPPAASPCGTEGNLDVGGADGGAVWLICPTILDPRNGAIAPDAFLDVVRAGGRKLDPRLADNFACLEKTGQFPVNGACQGDTSATGSSIP
jgi:hypothetical protein